MSVEFRHLDIQFRDKNPPSVDPVVQSKASRCSICTVYKEHATISNETDLYNKTWSLPEDMFANWEVVGKNEWQASLILFGKIVFLHNDLTHICFVPELFLEQQASSSRDNAKRRRIESTPNDEDHHRFQVGVSVHTLNASPRALTFSIYDHCPEFLISSTSLVMCSMEALNGITLPFGFYSHLQDICAKGNYMMPLKMIQHAFKVKWKGMVFGHQMNRSVTFYVFKANGEICEVPVVIREVPLATSHISQRMDWTIIYDEQTLMMDSEHFSETLQLSSTDTLFNYVPNQCAAEMTFTNQATSNVSLSNILQSFYPFRHKTEYICTATTAALNLQGEFPSIIVFSKIDHPDFRVRCGRIKINVRDPYSFRMSKIHLSEISLQVFAQFNKKTFATKFCDYGLQNMQLPESTWHFENSRCKLPTCDSFATELLQYCLCNLALAKRKQITSFHVELLSCDLAFRKFIVQREEMQLCGANCSPQIVFHGVRAPNALEVTENIIKCGFNEKHAKVAMYGGGGIYCSPDFGCALEYVSEDSKMRVENYVFVCLALLGNSKRGGTQNQPMGPDQHSWIANVRPYTYYCVEKQGLLPCALLRFE